VGEKFDGFRSWFKAQVDRSDPVGHLAYDAFGDNCCLKFMKSPASFSKHLEVKHGLYFSPMVEALHLEWDKAFAEFVLKPEDLKICPILFSFLESYEDPDEDEKEFWMAWCPYCDDWHRHHFAKGLRGPLCVRESSPFLKTGYKLKLSKKPFHDFKLRTPPRRKIVVSSKARFAVLKRDGFQCQYCGKKAPEAELRVDHRIPVAHEGTNDPSNLITACHPCNAGKGKMIL
jgi:hypothetical protein